MMVTMQGKQIPCCSWKEAPSSSGRVGLLDESSQVCILGTQTATSHQNEGSQEGAYMGPWPVSMPHTRSQHGTQSQNLSSPLKPTHRALRICSVTTVEMAGIKLAPLDTLWGEGWNEGSRPLYNVTGYEGTICGSSH